MFLVFLSGWKRTIKMTIKYEFYLTEYVNSIIEDAARAFTRSLSPGIRKPRAYLGIVLQVQKPQVKEQDVETYM